MIEDLKGEDEEFEDLRDPWGIPKTLEDLNNFYKKIEEGGDILGLLADDRT